MRRWLAFLLALTLGASLMACGKQNGAEEQPAPAQEGETQQDTSAQDTPAPEEESQEPAAEASEADGSQSAELAAPEETEVARFANQDGYEAPCLFRPEKDGVYRFHSANSNEELWMYDPEAILWSVYVLDEEFEDGWRYLSQAYRPAIDRLLGEITVELKAGQYVYCIPSVNSFTGDPAEDNTAALTITLTNAEFGPTASNGWVQPVSINTQCEYDLDGDGQAEQIYYAINDAYQDEEGVWYEALPTALQINDQEFLNTTEGENPFQPFDTWLEAPNTGRYYLVDLDSSDDYVELAVCDWGSDDWNMTLLFRYADGKLVYLDAITGFPDAETTVYHGDGTVSAYRHFDVMQTWGGIVTYQLTEGMMQRVKDEMVQPNMGELTITLKKPLTVYSEADKSSEKLTLQPDGKPLSFPLTDTEHWVQIVCADGTTGWAYFDPSFMVENDGQTVQDTEIFDGLLFAG